MCTEMELFRAWLITCLLFTSLSECIGNGNRQTGLVLQTNSSCGVCAGQQLVYECTAVGPGTTIWEGSAFQCAGGNILLSHSEFSRSSGTTDECNRGAIVGRSLGITDGNCYTSQLSITTDVSMDGQTVQCVHNNRSRDIPIGTRTIDIITDLFDAPRDVHVTNINLDTGHISFNWSSVSTNCPAILYQITTIDCGTCPLTTTNTSITCHSIVAGHVCSVAIRTVACGTMAGNPSSSVSVTLRTPNPSNVHCVPLYSKATKRLRRIITTFEQAESFMISDGIDGSTISYTIAYVDSISGNICSSAAIPASSCVKGICNHTFEVSLSSCPPCVDINITVYATNILGNGGISDPLTIGSMNQFVNVEFDLLSLTVHCTFEQPALTSAEKSCSIVYGPGEQCTNLSLFSRSQSTTSNLVVIDYHPLPSLQSESVYCYVLTAFDGTFSASIEGTFSTGCDPQQLSDNTSLSNGVSCSTPLHSLGIRNGIVCYNGIDTGAIAFYSCFKCNSQVIFSHWTVRVCLPNGKWNGTIPQCECDVSVGLSHSNTGGVTGLTLALVTTVASLGLIIFIMLIIFITVVVVMARTKTKLLTELRQVKSNVLYDEIGLPPSIDSSIAKNIAYDSVTK